MSQIPSKKDGWGAIAQFILTKESDKSWVDDVPLEGGALKRKVKPSFTRWGKDRAKQIGISDFLFWQYRRAGLFYNKLHEISTTTPTIPLAELSDQVSPENLSELQKIHRVAPTDLFNQLCIRLIEKRNIGRKELRTLWKSLSPALYGATARGRDRGAAVESFISERGLSSVFPTLEGLVIVAFNEHASKILGFSDTAPLVDIRDLPRNDDFYIDFVIITPGETLVDKPMVHGFTFYWHSRFSSTSNLESIATDLHWIILLNGNNESCCDHTCAMASCGIITVTSTPDEFDISKVTLNRQAKSNPKLDQAAKSELVTRILLQELS